MAPKTRPLSQTQHLPKPKRLRTVNLKEVDGPEPTSPVKTMKFDPLTAFAQTVLHKVPSSSNVSIKNPLSSSSSQKSSSQSNKGKAKAKELEVADHSLWVDMYEPTTEAELAVHVRKVDDIRKWVIEAFEGGPSGKLAKYRRILALTGPAGAGKTATLRVLAKELDFEILEWQNSVVETHSSSFGELSGSSLSNSWNSGFSDYESLFSKFETFLTRATRCYNILNIPSSSLSRTAPRRRIILLEDLPNVLHPKTQTQFHEALTALVSAEPTSPPVPIVIIISDAGMRGESNDERMGDRNGRGKERAQVVDIRTVLPRNLLGGPYVTEISFNSIAPTLLRKALQAMISTHFGNSPQKPSKEVLDVIIDSANGDIRSAIMALQFACVMDIPTRKKKNTHRGVALVLQSVTRREQTLALFHLLGKVLYNKRKNDSPSSSASAKDIEKERMLDAALNDCAKLPSHLSHHERRTSRVDVDTIYADSPIESSLFSLYIHQNYNQFCNQIEESEGVADWLSWVDSSGGEMWYQANPHQFHLLTLGTLHSLPSPVPRRSQKYYKPEFFSFLQKEKDAWEGVRVIRDWLLQTEVTKGDSGWRPGGWTKNEILLELGGVLRAKDVSLDPKSRAPPIHRLFSRIEFSRKENTVHSQQLNEKDVETENYSEADADLAIFSPSSTKEGKGSWLESDDIENFD